MEIVELPVPDAYLVTPRHLRDPRGAFFEIFRAGAVGAALGRPFPIAQVNFSTSRRNTLRGIHGTITPPGQAKVVMCVRGAVLDAVVDLRVGSPAFGRCSVNRLDSRSGAAVCVAEGLGHAFLALSEEACVGYLCSTEFVAGTQVDVNPLDPSLDLPWRTVTSDLVLSAKDRDAMSVAEAAAAGKLPAYDECRRLYARAGADPAPPVGPPAQRPPVSPQTLRR
ncbi:dTDP-4-dehydrorhamnose 3,5-epimerase family protein [Dactylosporangium sp. CA-092794]|uniref:dTDP-4-dehydrorhamnose 3,5-epimerase family protein n=1 Tax=Dactylosporangium sp. CA-092794 TaxID=3239929 RepID=UPI003D8A7278